MTFNFWTDHPRHPPWAGRRDGAAAIVARHRPDLLGGQELRAHQVADLAARLREDYAWLGVGRDDGAGGGEFNPVFYRRERFEPRDGGTFWLSPEPDQPGSRGWGAACPRVVTWARFAERVGDGAGTDDVWLFNTHLDHASFRARREGARLLVRRVHDLAGPGARVVLTGDLNGGERSAAVVTLRGGGWRDSFRAAAKQTPGGARQKTWRGFHGSGLGAARLDYVFTLGEDVHVSHHAVLDDRGADGRIVSDHRPVLVDLEWAGHTRSHRA